MVKNSQIASILRELANYLEIEGENPFKIRAYKKAARVVESLGEEIEQMVKNREDLTKLPSIGKEIAAKIEEIVKTGRLQKLEELKRKIPPSLVELLSLEGLGAKKIKALYENLNITNYEELKEAALSHKIRELPGFGPKIEEKILKGLKLLKQEGFRFLYIEVEEVAKELKEYIKSFSLVDRVEVAGSFRRAKESIADLDIVVSTNSPKEVIDYFLEFKAIEEIIVAGETKGRVVLDNKLQVDLRAIKPLHFGAALHYFTGSQSHVVAIRQLALDMGLKINEYGVFKGEKIVASKSEDEVYGALNLAYIEPELRENRGEIEAAKSNRLPILIEQDDLRGDLHMHTIYSDGANSIEEMALAAKEMGYEYIAISDHYSTIALLKGLNPKKILKEFEEIDRLNSKLNISILKSLEVDILEDGSLAASDEILKRADIVVAAVHTKLRLSKKEQTKRVVRALLNRYVNILAHPMNRLIRKRDSIDIDFKEIFKVAKDNNIFLEINSQPTRLDLNDILAKEAKEMGVRFAISSDAHNIKELEFIKYGINQARRGWIEKKDVLNTLPLEELLEAIKR
ncbi:MAG: DNA polymerase/3'-5' exonuclease PolX [Epsilonproteobacteria bacterium]|nr:DNA polymerase/3'-5' exonuclease PolX [Campylobacterota bacterium]